LLRGKRKRRRFFPSADYHSWKLPRLERYELYKGEAYAMSAPSLARQIVLLRMGVLLQQALQGKPCSALIAPVDVRLFPRDDESDTTVARPDIIVVRCSSFNKTVISPAVSAAAKLAFIFLTAD
jgi:hypothetical protein